MNNKLLSMLLLYKNIGIDFVYSKEELKSKRQVASSSQKINKQQEENIRFQSRLSKTIPEPKTIPEHIVPENQNNQVLRKIHIDLSQIVSITELKNYLQNFKECKLQKTALNTILGCGNEQAEIMLIGEAPGALEDEMGEPFVGRSGKLLMQVFNSIGIKREDMFISNTVFWRPPGNRVPSIEENNICYPFLHKLIYLIKPKFIIAIGRSAASVILNTDDTIGKLRGQWFLSDNIKPKNGLTLPVDIHITTVYHPAYLLRSYSQKKVFWEDILNIKLKLINQGG